MFTQWHLRKRQTYSWYEYLIVRDGDGDFKVYRLVGQFNSEKSSYPSLVRAKEAVRDHVDMVDKVAL